MSQRDEKCPNCGSDRIAIARDMIGTRKCVQCWHSWVPVKEPRPDTIQVPRELWEEFKRAVRVQRQSFELFGHDSVEHGRAWKDVRLVLEAIKKAGL